MRRILCVLSTNVHTTATIHLACTRIYLLYGDFVAASVSSTSTLTLFALFMPRICDVLLLLMVFYGLGFAACVCLFLWSSSLTRGFYLLLCGVSHSHSHFQSSLFFIFTLPHICFQIILAFPALGTLVPSFISTPLSLSPPHNLLSSTLTRCRCHQMKSWKYTWKCELCQLHLFTSWFMCSTVFISDFFSLRCIEYYNLLTLSCTHTNINSYHFVWPQMHSHAVHTLHTLELFAAGAGVVVCVYQLYTTHIF